jgi:hypothetical protein
MAEALIDLSKQNEIMPDKRFFYTNGRVVWCFNHENIVEIVFIDVGDAWEAGNAT